MSSKCVISANAVAKDGCGLELKMFKDILLTVSSFHLNSSVVLRLFKKFVQGSGCTRPCTLKGLINKYFKNKENLLLGPYMGKNVEFGTIGSFFQKFYFTTFPHSSYHTCIHTFRKIINTDTTTRHSRK